MTREELWKIYTDKNPQFIEEGGQVTLSTAGLRKMFYQTFTAGFDAGKGAAEALHKMHRSNSDDKDIFDRMFGKR